MFELGIQNKKEKTYGMGVAGTNIYQDLKNGNRVNGWDVSDLTIGGASIAATIFLASNPVGWMITGGATFYCGARLIYDVAKSR